MSLCPLLLIKDHNTVLGFLEVELVRSVDCFSAERGSGPLLTLKPPVRAALKYLLCTHTMFLCTFQVRSPRRISASANKPDSSSLVCILCQCRYAQER